MSRSTTYFRPNEGPKRRRRRGRENRPSYNNGGESIGKNMIIGLVVAVCLGVSALVVMTSLRNGQFGIFEAYHGRVWSVSDLTMYLKGEGLYFDEGTAADLQSVNMNVLRLQFEGYAEELADASEGNLDLTTRLHREENVKRQVHVVYVIKLEPGQEQPSIASSQLYGSSWTWGNFLFRGDSRNIDEIRGAVGGGYQ